MDAKTYHLSAIILLVISPYVSSLTSTPRTTTNRPDAYTVQGKVHNLQSTYVTSESVGLSWGAPRSVDMTGYAIYIRKGNICETAFFLSCIPNGYIPGPPCNYNRAVTVPCHDVMSYNVTRIKSYTNYVIRVAATNKFIVGDNSSIQVHTKVGISDPPTNIRGRPLNSSAILVEWTIPAHEAGPTVYNIRVLEALNKKAVPKYESIATYNVSGYDSSSYVVGGLLSWWRYQFEVTASTTAGISKRNTSSVVTTLQSAPAVVRNLSVSYVTDHYMALLVSWDCPLEKQRNGLITNYTVEYTAGNVSLSANVGSYYPEDPCTELHRVLLPVQPNVNYIMTVFANAEFTGEENSLSFYADLNKMKYIVHPTSNPTDPHSDTLYTVSGVCGSVIVVLLIMIGVLYFSK